MLRPSRDSWDWLGRAPPRRKSMEKPPTGTTDQRRQAGGESIRWSGLERLVPCLENQHSNDVCCLGRLVQLQVEMI